MLGKSVLTILFLKKSKTVPLHAMEVHGGERRYSSYSFLTSALDGGEWSASRPGRALPPGTHCTGGWVSPRAGLDREARRKILCLCRGPKPGRPVCSQSLYCLSYPVLIITKIHRYPPPPRRSTPGWRQHLLSSTLSKLPITWSVSDDDYLDAFRSQKKNWILWRSRATAPVAPPP
jgi:hypothetical protein